MATVEDWADLRDSVLRKLNLKQSLPLFTAGVNVVDSTQTDSIYEQISTFLCSRTCQIVNCA